MQPLLLEHIAQLRIQISASEQHGGRHAELWKLIKSSARSAPFDFPWFTPFVALITQDARDIANAADVIRRYVGKLDSMYFSTGLQFHFWCFAFPHAKWCMYFQWLCTLGAFDDEEAQQIAAQLVEYHFVNFLYGLRTKPEPDCVDNQALSLALSTTLVGYIFTQAPYQSRMAEIMRDEGLRRLPIMIGDMPPSGYSGEGSSYMDCVNGPAIPLAIELMQRITGQSNLLHQQFTANGATPYRILLMVAREWMPGGLLLPWDNYGYQFGVRAPLAYAAHVTGEALFTDILMNDTIWSYDIGTGWAYDDLVWTLIWWPHQHAASTPTVSRSWFEPTVGGALVSDNRDYYAMQMWDESTPVVPTRSHVNPNAVLFNGYGVPLSADGSPIPAGVARFRFADTVRRVNFLTMGQEDEYNYGDGCGGAHSIIVVDGWEGLRLQGDGAQYQHPHADLTQHTLGCDVAPTYQERWPDIRQVLRRTTLCAQRFFVIEDYCQSDDLHTWTTRFLLRPDFVACTDGVKIQTPEGVTLQLMPVLVPAQITTEAVSGHPAKPDGRCGIADFHYHGTTHHQLTLAWIAQTRVLGRQICQFAAIADYADGLNEITARQQLAQSSLRLDLQLPAHMEADVPAVKRWWYHTIIPDWGDAGWIKLPVGMMSPQIWLNGAVVDMRPYGVSGELIAPQIAIPSDCRAGDALDLLICVDVPISHYEGGGDGTIGLTGGVWLMHPIDEDALIACTWAENQLHVRSTSGEYWIPYHLSA